MNDEVWDFVNDVREQYRSLLSLHAAVLARFPGINLGYSTFTSKLREKSYSDKAKAEQKKPGPERDQQLIQDIEHILEEDPTLSCRKMALRLGKPESTVRSYLHDVLGRVYKKTRWVPHILSPEQKKLRVELSRKLL